MSMKQSTPMGKPVNLNKIFSFILTVSLIFLSCTQKKERSAYEYDYDNLPAFESTEILQPDSLAMTPVRVEIYNETLFVSYSHKSQIDIFTTDFEYINTIRPDSPAVLFPTSFAVTDSSYIIVDHTKGLVCELNRRGELLNSFGSLPDSSTGLAPYGLFYYGGVAYTSDIGIKKVLAISMADAAGITEKGELILQIPSDSTVNIGMPSAVYVTFDGRLLIGDAEHGLVRVFTCDGNHIYNFDSIPGFDNVTPQDFTTDRLIDPSLQDSTSFDPSGIRSMGRIHMVDSYNRVVHMFNPRGKYIASYPHDNRLQKPSGIAYSPQTRRIYIADPAAGKIFVYKEVY